jgi:hypothetical protein
VLTGICCVLASGTLHIQRLTPANPLILLAVVALAVMAGFAVRSLLGERCAAPRPVDAVSRRTTPWWLVAGIALGVLAAGGAVVILWTIVRPPATLWVPVLAGTVGAATALYLAQRSKCGRYYVLAAVSPLLGAGIALMGTDARTQLALYLGGTGAALIGSGGIAWVRSLGTGSTDAQGGSTDQDQTTNDRDPPCST